MTMHILTLAATFFTSLTVVVSAAEPLRYRDFAARLTDLERLATPIVPGEKTGASTSHDRGSTYDAASDSYQNWSANGDGGGNIRTEGDESVLVDLQGPGVLWRIWSAKADAGHIRIFLDGQATPVVDQPFADFFDGLQQEYPGLAMTLSRGRNSFVPIPFAKSCKVVLGKGWGAYFHCTHTLFAAGTEVETFPGFTPDVTAALRQASDAWLDRGNSPWAAVASAGRSATLEVAPGESRDLTVTGAGAVRVLRVRPLNLPSDPLAQEDALRELTISLYWDGEAKPSVWAPLGDFFGTSPGLNPFRTRPTGCIDGQFYSYWYMPFAAGMRLLITNDGAVSRQLAVELETVPLETAAAAKLLRFCAAWHADDFTGLDAPRFLHKRGDRWPDWPLLAVRGSGRFVGMTQHIWKYGGWWGEGDEKFFVDGEKFPSSLGTGSEDYIGYAWAAEPPFITFDSAAAACSRLRPDAQQDTSVCRFHLCDDIPFATGFEGFMEVMPNGDCRPALYDTCVYWYREQDARNPYPLASLQARRHQRPAREMKRVLPATFPMAPAKPGILEGEDLTVRHVSSGRHWVQDMSGYSDGTWSNDAHLIWTDATLGEQIEIEFRVSSSGEQRLYGAFTKAVDYGMFELWIDEQPIERIFDFYDMRVTTTGEIPLGTFNLAEGKHTLRAKVIGRNPRVKEQTTGAHILGLDYLRMEKQR